MSVFLTLGYVYLGVKLKTHQVPGTRDTGRGGRARTLLDLILHIFSFTRIVWSGQHRSQNRGLIRMIEHVHE